MVKVNDACVSVVDCDTFDTNTGVRIRLARVDGPSLNTTRGQSAKSLLESLILNELIKYKVVAGDDYGRSVAEVWVNSANVNDAMIAQGYK